MAGRDSRPVHVGPGAPLRARVVRRAEGSRAAHCGPGRATQRGADRRDRGCAAAALDGRDAAAAHADGPAALPPRRPAARSAPALRRDPRTAARPVGQGARRPEPGRGDRSPRLDQRAAAPAARPALLRGPPRGLLAGRARAVGAGPGARCLDRLLRGCPGARAVGRSPALPGVLRAAQRPAGPRWRRELCPITNAQWQAWGGRSSYSANDSDLNRPNQPVVGLQWAWCNQFCAWLSAQTGASIRLPTEQEWEAAARGGDTRRYPWGDDWRADHAATAEDRAGRGWEWSVPVGCYPAGAAPCGALDMAGNVREWTASVWRSYPKANNVFTDEQRRALRGGSYRDERTDVRCGARVRVPLRLLGRPPQRFSGCARPLARTHVLISEF
ncbi:MAG: SUMF1/EgtB/PvdO family nonheme iron enzyme [Chloroflexi bacterium]|nr:SUMF1/EgtB/PvdO family nonheme iron enzyme [Chloroflexota bacterium]